MRFNELPVKKPIQVTKTNPINTWERSSRLRLAQIAIRQKLKPNLLWSIYFVIKSRQQQQRRKGIPNWLDGNLIVFFHFFRLTYLFTKHF